jgi:TonB family protein
MSSPGAAGVLSRRSTLAGSASLALHGGVVLLGVALVGAHVAPAPRPLALTSIEVVSPLPPSPVATPAPAPAPAARAIAPSPVARAIARPARAAPPRTASAVEALDLRVRYDDPNNFASSRADAEREPSGIDEGRGIGAESRRQLEDSVGHLQIPVPPPVSFARAPRPKHNYHQLRLHSVRRFAGMTVRLVLTIDARGRVSDVELVQGVDGQLDRRVVELARRFEFEPGVDQDGAPTAGTSRWDIQIVDDDNGQLRNSMERGYF